VKALSPVCRVRGRYRSFLDFHRAAARSVAREANARLPHVVTTSYATHSAIARHAESWRDDPHVEPWLSEGRRFGLRHVPTLRDLERAGYGGGSEPRDWVANRGETSDFREGEARGCLHPPGHARELPNLLENGVLADLLDAHPALEVLFVHNVDSLGARLDPGLLGWFLDQPLDVAFELMPRWHGDEGGALARVEGRLRLVEGLALPRAELAGSLSTYSSMTSWLSIDGWLASLGLSRAELRDADRVAAAVASALARLPRYLTLKPVRVRGDDGRHRTRLAGQVEQLWGDVTAHGDLRCGYLAVSRVRGQQQKDPEGLDAWLHDGSLETVRAGCAWDGDPAAPTDQEPC
jgi:hypothetical protein